MPLHLLEFRSGQFSRLVENVLGDREFSHVVEQRRRRNCFEVPILAHAQSLGELEREHLYASDVAMGDLILRVHRHRESFDRGEIKLIHLCDVSIGVLDPCPRSSKSKIENYDQRN